MRKRRAYEALIALAVGCGIAACKAGDSGGGSLKVCTPGATMSCGCSANPALTTTCRADGSGFEVCSCASGITGAQAGSTAMAPAAGGPGATPPAGTGGMVGIPNNTGGTGSMTPAAGRPGGAAGMQSGMTLAGRSGGAGTTPPAGTGGSPTTGAGGSGSSDDINMLRDLCVAEINMYRAMLTNAPPLKRATAAQEMCSDMGAMSDGDTMSPHGFFKMAGSCISKVGLSAQDSCPGYPVGGFGAATVADAFKGCMKQMWAEGEPPNGRDACMQDVSGCFQMHGHYLNMSNPKATAVSCAFYKMKDGKSWWMNQDFVISWP